MLRAANPTENAPIMVEGLIGLVIVIIIVALVIGVLIILARALPMIGVNV